jgi:hypothetical protein
MDDNLVVMGPLIVGVVSVLVLAVPLAILLFRKKSQEQQPEERAMRRHAPPEPKGGFTIQRHKQGDD